MSSIYEEHKDEDGFLYITYVLFQFFPFLDSFLGSVTDYNNVTDTPAKTRLVTAKLQSIISLKPGPFSFVPRCRGPSRGVFDPSFFWEVDSGTGDNSRTVDGAEGQASTCFSCAQALYQVFRNDFAWRTIIGLVSLN